MSNTPLRPVTEDERAAFRRDGAVLLKQVLPHEWLPVLEAGLDEAIGNRDSMSTDLGDIRVDQFPAAKSPALRRIINESPVAELVGTALDSPVSFYMDQLFAKPSGYIPPTEWHQDTCYYNVDGRDLVRAWVSPDPVPRNVSLEVVRGLHLWNATYAPLAGREADAEELARSADAVKSQQRLIGTEAFEKWSYFSGVRDTTLPPVPPIEKRRESFDIIGWDYEPGDVILFHGHILHSARGDVVAENQRRSHASLWAGRRVHYLHRPGQIIPDPIGLYAHEPKSGQPLTDFPDVFPIIWSPETEN